MTEYMVYQVFVPVTVDDAMKKNGRGEVDYSLSMQDGLVGRCEFKFAEVMGVRVRKLGGDEERSEAVRDMLSGGER